MPSDRMIKDVLPGRRNVDMMREHSVGAVQGKPARMMPKDQLKGRVEKGFTLAEQSFKNPPAPAARKGQSWKKNKPGA